ncbi:hypothetical protein HPB47_005026 [Ixodes persulcatus]|uniref:Uncharacterized protein n=1 Tax=Ixodes persulcatus TaxID=34615 RepID=A0AC60PEY8_IXOPE|nr:hypothetical protein HPB47_005026 [Ixodes persulcatus]
MDRTSRILQQHNRTGEALDHVHRTPRHEGSIPHKVNVSWNMTTFRSHTLQEFLKSKNFSSSFRNPPPTSQFARLKDSNVFSRGVHEARVRKAGRAPNGTATHHDHAVHNHYEGYHTEEALAMDRAE